MPNMTYTVSYTTTGPCPSSISHDFTVLPSEDPGFTYVSGCGGAVVTVTGDAGGTFSFSPAPGDGAQIDALTGEVTGGTSGATYGVSYVTSGPCPAELVQDVSVLPLDDASFTIDPTCDGGVATIVGTTGGTFTLSPDPGDGTVVDAVTGTVTGGQPGATYTIEYLTSGTCSQSETHEVTVHPTEDPSFTLTANCGGATAAVDGDTGGMFSLSPDLGDGASVDASTGELINAVSGTTYTVSYTTAGPCPSSISHDVTVPGQEDPGFTYVSGCGGAVVTVTGDAGGTFTFSPAPGDGAQIDALTGEVTGGTPGATYGVSYVTSGPCPAELVQDVSVLSLDDASFTVAPTCDGGVATVTGLPGGTFTFSPAPGDGAQVDALTGEVTGGTPGAAYTLSYATNGPCPNASQVPFTVHPEPVAVQPTPLEVCDDGTPDGFTQIDLSIKNTEVSGGNGAYQLSYYVTQAQADAGLPADALPTVYTNTSNPQTVYVRVEDPSTGCYVTVPLELAVEQAPVANVPPDLTFCDPDSDGFGSFDLEGVTPQVTGGDASLTVTYHETLAEAEGNVNAQASPYSNISAYAQTLWVRVESSTIATDCATVVELHLVVYDTPAIEHDPAPLEVCDDDADGFARFDLTGAGAVVLNGLDPVRYQVGYYLSEADAEVPTGAIASPGDFTNTVAGGQVLWVRVDDTANGCHSTAPLGIVVNPLPVFHQPSPLELCDDGVADGLTAFDLTVRDAEVTGGDGSLSVGYYGTLAEAEAGTGWISPATSYTNASVNGAPANPQTLWVRVEDPSTGCYVVGTLTLRVLPNPTPTASELLQDLELCDDTAPGDMVETFDLTAYQTELLNGEAGVTPTYHETLGDAELGANAIADPTAYANTAPHQTVYVRVTNDATGCYTVVHFDITVHPLPESPSVSDYQVCEVRTDGVYGFDLSTKDAEALGGQDPSLYGVTYHATQAGADGGTGALLSPYGNITNPQTIYVRIEDLATGCSVSTSTFEIEVFDGAEANPDMAPISYMECDDNMEFDGDATDDSVQFDLSTRDAEVLDGQDPGAFTVSYYLTQGDAELGANALPPLYENVSNPQTLWARVDNDGTAENFCYAVASLELVVLPLPAFDLAEAYVICEGTNGSEVLAPAVLDTGLDASLYVFEWSLDGTVIAGATGSSYVPAVGGSYGVTVTDPLTQCSSSDVAEVEVSSPPSLVAEVVTAAFSGVNVVEAVATGTGVSAFEYSLDDGPWQESGTFTGVPLGEHVVSARDINGCGVATATVTVLDYPEYFTPNGDGYHDTWNIYGLGSQASAKIYIFDRYGKLLKQLSPSGTGWDGTYNGSPMPTDDYWFTVEYAELSSTNPADAVNTSIKQFKAHFTLKR